MERELFGNGKDQLGMVDLADEGTLYLSEIQLLPTEVQIRLTRLIRDGIVEDPSSGTSKKLNVRVLAASSHSAEALLSENLLRENLYYLLSVFTIMLPPLRERFEDFVWTPLLLCENGKNICLHQVMQNNIKILYYFEKSLLVCCIYATNQEGFLSAVAYLTFFSSSRAV